MIMRPTPIAALLAAAALAAPAAAQDWSGPYAGVAAGAARGSGDADLGDFGGDLISRDVANGLFPEGIGDADAAGTGGAFVGYNLQRGAFVGGAELDLTLGGPDSDAGFARRDADPASPFVGVNTVTGYGTDLDGLATLRLRAGWSFGPTLVYATAGVAGGRVGNAFSLSLPELGYARTWSEDGDRWGAAFGVGVERRLTERLSLRAEVLRYDLADVTIEASDEAAFPGNAASYRFDNDGAIARLGVSFRF